MRTGAVVTGRVLYDERTMPFSRIRTLLYLSPDGPLSPSRFFHVATPSLPEVLRLDHPLPPFVIFGDDGPPTISEEALRFRLGAIFFLLTAGAAFEEVESATFGFLTFAGRGAPLASRRILRVSSDTYSSHLELHPV